MSLAKLEKKVKSQAVQIQKQNQVVADLKQHTSKCIDTCNMTVQAMQAWEQSLRQQMKIVHSMAIAVNVLVDKGVITAIELEAKNKSMNDQAEEARRALRKSEETLAASTEAETKVTAFPTGETK
jgi:hypothetical protein